jgi:hypothetical protein
MWSDLPDGEASMEHDDRVTLSVANAHFVTDRLAVGGDLDLYDAELVVAQVLELKAAGITHVLDVRREWDDAVIWADVPGVAYRWDGIDDAGQRVPGAWFEGVATWALEALRDPDAKLLTHCHMGINRGPSAGYAVLLALGWDPIEALDAIRRARPLAHVAYAEDALRWHHERTGADPATRDRDRRRMQGWREENDLDLLGVIRRIRRHEAS